MMVNLGINLTGLRDTQIADKVLFLGTSMRMFGEEMDIWINGLSKEDPPYSMWEGTIQLAKGLYKTKMQRKVFPRAGTSSPIFRLQD